MTANKLWQQMRQAENEFWAHHPELWDDRKKIQVLMIRQPGGGFVAGYRWKDAADRRQEREEWIIFKLFHCDCPTCPSRRGWRMLVWHVVRKVAKKLRII